MTAAEVSARVRRFVLAGVGFLLVWQVARLAGVPRRTEVVLGLSGFVLHVLFGKAYALLPAYFDRGLAWPRAPAVQFPLTVLGVLGLAATDNYRGVVDRTGAETVRVAVGADGNGGQFAFEPAAIHVDPGTTVVWEWVGTAGAYDVVDETLGYASEQVRGAGHAFALRFGNHGVSRYQCTTYGDRGMRGVVLVGEGPQETLTWQGVGAAGAVGIGVAAPLAYGLRLHERTATKGGE